MDVGQRRAEWAAPILFDTRKPQSVPRQLLLIGLLAPVSLSPVRAQGPASEPKAVGFTIANLDTSANACTDFFQFACGNWVKANPVPNDRPRWGTFNELGDRNRNTLETILDAAVAAGAKASPADRTLADFYGSCMDEG